MTEILELLDRVLVRYHEWGPFFGFMVFAYLRFSHSKYLQATLYAALALIWLKFSLAFFLFLNMLGADSFFEAR